MRKIVSVTCLVILLGVGCAAEARAQFGAGEKFKESTAAESYAEGHLEVFGRPPLPNEATYWKAQQLTRTQMIDQLKLWLRKPEGSGELSATIERSYMNSFGRKPTPEELAYWQAEVKAKHYGYTHIIDASRQWLKSAAGAADREPTIDRAYTRAFGRKAKPQEMSYWKSKMQQEGTTFTELVDRCIDWMLGSGPEQIGELKGTILRAYSALKRSPPNEDQLKYWMAQASAKRLTYQLLVALIPKSTV
jgi:hypothetical protein